MRIFDSFPLYNHMDNHYEAQCVNCGKQFLRHKRQNPKYKISWETANLHREARSGREYCSQQCRAEYKSKTENITKPCAWCNKSVTRPLSQFKKSKSERLFCNQSCACSFNNTQKRKCHRSKSEKLLFQKIADAFPDLEIIPNDKTILDGYEADIAIPEINLCIEWNGIVHYQPIYGQAKLNAIQQRDADKRRIAQEKNIDLIVVPDLVSTEKYVNEAFQKIKAIIQQKLWGEGLNLHNPSGHTPV